MNEDYCHEHRRHHICSCKNRCSYCSTYLNKGFCHYCHEFRTSPSNMLATKLIDLIETVQFIIENSTVDEVKEVLENIKNSLKYE